MKENELPPGWAWTTLGDVVEVLDHKRVPVSAKIRATRPGKVPYYGATGQVGWIDESIFDEELVLLGEDGVQFFNRQGQKAYLVHGPSWVNNHAHVLRSIDGLVSANYLMHYLNVFNYEGYANGTTRLKLTKSAMLGIPIPLPPRAEQERIVDSLEGHLSRLDVAVSGLESSKFRAEILRKSMVYKGITGKLSKPVESDKSVQELVNGIDRLISEQKSKRRKTFVSGFTGAEYPNHWAVRPLGSLCIRIEYGTSAKTAEGNSPTDVPVLRMGNIQGGRIDVSNLKYLPEGHPEVKKLLLEEGDLLFNRTNSAELVGKSAVYHAGLGAMTFASYLIRCKLAPGIEAEWVNLFINSFEGRRYIKSVTSQQVGQANVNGTKLAGLPIPVPPHEEQLRILGAVDEWDSTVMHSFDTANRALRQSRMLRQSLYRAAFSGQLVEQRASDEPASTLLERIKAEKRAQLKSKRRRAANTATASTRPAPSISSDPAGTFIQEELGL